MGSVDVAELARSVLFMRQKLKETRIALAKQPIVIPDERMGVRENPAFAAYEKLNKEYRISLKELEEISGYRNKSKSSGKLIDMKKQFKVG